ncbi:MAG TPA: transposase [Vicinamibacterales bacterium]|nr:transposase [Vicinamibacterales bacterium]
MPRSARRFVDGLPYHVLNRGNRRQVIFSQDVDYEIFLTTVADAIDKVPIAILAFALMPTHFHLVLWPQNGTDISSYMRWLMNAHIRRYHRFTELWGTGHIYQGRFKAFPIQTDHHLLTVLRYVEANPLRAQLVPRAEAWRWSSLTRVTSRDGRPLITPAPTHKPSNWVDIVNERLPMPTYDALRSAAQRQVPFGDPEWIRFLEQRNKQRITQAQRPRTQGHSHPDVGGNAR